MRLDITWFATKYVHLERKVSLHKMLASVERQESRFARIGTEGSHAENLATRQTF